MQMVKSGSEFVLCVRQLRYLAFRMLPGTALYTPRKVTVSGSTCAIWYSVTVK